MSEQELQDPTGRACPDEKNLEDRLNEIDEIIHKLSKNELSLNDSLREFEKGIGLVRACEAEISDTEKKLKVLTENGEVNEF